MIYVYLSNVIIKKNEQQQKNDENLIKKKSYKKKHYRFTSKTKTFLTISHFFFSFLFLSILSKKIKEEKKTHTFNKRKKHEL